MFKIIKYLLVFSYVSIWSEKTNENSSYVLHSKEEMQEHRRICKDKMRSNTSNIQDPNYPMARALLNVDGDDTDYIPKVVGAGEICYEGIVPYQLMHNGVKVVLNCYYDSQWLTDVIHGLKGHHEPQEEKCFYEVLKYIPENATMIELGSYWAYYSLWFASEVKGAKNYMIEPDPRRLEIGRKNFELNNMSGVFQRGFVGKMKDDTPDVNGTELISVDDFIEKERIQHVHILHSDIQGAEAEMLETTVKHLDKIDYFFISTHNHQTDHPACLKFFEAHGLIILAEHMDVESAGGDGLIVAKRKGVAGPDHIEIRKYNQLNP